NRIEEQFNAGVREAPADREDQLDDHKLNETLPPKISVLLSDRLYIHKEDLSSRAINKFIRLASFLNPEFYKAQAMRLSTYGKPRVITCAEDLPHHIALPRGCYQAVEEFIIQNHSTVLLEDNRF